MKRIAILAAVLGVLTCCRGKSPSWEKSAEYGRFCASLESLQAARDSLFNLSESLSADAPDGEVLRLMEERLAVEAIIWRVKQECDEAERMYYLKQAAKR